MKLAVVINRPSNSARVLAEALGCKRIRPERVGVAKASRRATLINWGCAGGPWPAVVKWLNAPVSITGAANKLAFLLAATDERVRVPQFWMDKEYVPRDCIVLARKTLTGSGGEGIVVVRPGDELPDAPLYTRYIQKSAEYRVHVVNGTVIFVQQKRKKNGVEQTRDQKLIRNHGNGWVFAENRIEFASEEQKTEVYNECVRAVACCSLDFGAVDVIIGATDGKPYVLEVNTAPGLESTALIQAYATAFTSEEQDDGI